MRCIVGEVLLTTCKVDFDRITNAEYVRTIVNSREHAFHVGDVEIDLVVEVIILNQLFSSLGRKITLCSIPELSSISSNCSVIVQGGIHFEIGLFFTYALLLAPLQERMQNFLSAVVIKLSSIISTLQVQELRYTVLREVDRT